MGASIRIGIAGYGNLGRGVQAAIAKNPDMELVGVYTRRDPATLSLPGGATAFHMDELARHTEEIDVLILCGGSKSDLPEQGPTLAASFNTVDSFDTHAKIPEHFAAVDAPATKAGKTALISAGWDPGMFSINRVYGEALLPDGETYTFWGRGLSQGHSDAIRRVPGVAAGVQYTIPSTEAIAKVRAGERPTLSTREKHVRECFVVLEDGADAEAVRESIVTMEHYFDQYDTTVNFLHAARRLCFPQRQHHRGTRPGHRVLADPAVEPRVHLQRAGGLRPCGAQDEPGRPDRCQDRVRRGPGPAVAEVR